MFKHSYARGVQNALVQGGHAAYPDDVTAAKVADYIAERMDIDPTHTAGVPREVTAALAGHLIDASKQFKQTPGFKAASVHKIASQNDLSNLAHIHSMDLMQKAAEGSTIEGGDKGNKEPASTNAEAKMDLGARPEGFAENSLGKTDVDTRPGAVGKEQEQPAKPKESPAGNNSAIDQTKSSALNEFIRKLANTGSTIMGGDKGNLETQSGHAEAKMDLAQRPMGYAVLPGQGALGELMKHVSGPAVIGKEVAQPNAPARSPGGSNSLTEMSHKAAGEDAFLTLFKKTAEEVAPYLPTVGDDAKVAHVRACMGMTTEEKAHYLQGLQKTAADKTAAELPPGSRGDQYAKHDPDATHSRPGAYDGRKGNQGLKEAEMPDFIKEKIEAKKDGDKDGDKAEKKDGDKDEKKDEKKEEKEASLADHLRRISASIKA